LSFGIFLKIGTKVLGKVDNFQQKMKVENEKMPNLA
jgi:hypothetical protein